LFITNNDKKPIPSFCKYTSCFRAPVYEFTDVKEGKPIILGYSCVKHFMKINNLLKKIHQTKKEKRKNG
jgi:hypothetical protein|tara:strand:+ start:1874 stop:2080 length:207 start_codon:yes stop_codon:yes gene_type:complete